MTFKKLTLDGTHGGRHEPKPPGTPALLQRHVTGGRIAGAPERATAHDGAHPDSPVVVLIVEDEEPIALALAYIVEDAGYIPIVASQGRQALELARAQHPALILTDLMMPQMSGKEFILALRREWQEQGWPLPPIILMTAASMRAALGVEADATLAKPFEIEQVEALLRTYLPVL